MNRDDSNMNDASYGEYNENAGSSDYSVNNDNEVRTKRPWFNVFSGKPRRLNFIGKCFVIFLLLWHGFSMWSADSTQSVNTAEPVCSVEEGFELTHDCP